ncbi:hypothetical protein VKS41_001453 [Umbelopsis sp. WA50703]
MLLPELSEELLINIIGFLNDEEMLPFGQTCRQFRQLSSNESVWKLMVLRQFGVSYKVQEESWKDMYERCKDDPRHNRICPHLSFISPRIVQRHYAHRYQAAIESKTKLTCNACGKHDESSLCFYMWPGRTRVYCKECCYRYHAAEKARHGILIRINMLQLYCFTCSRILGETRGDPSEAQYIDNLLETLTEGSEKGKLEMKKRRRCLAEREMYYNEVDKLCVLRADQYYFIDRLWMTKWFLSLCDGRIAEEKVTNQHLTSDGGRFSHEARPNGSFSGGFSIVSPTLWHYLAEEYGIEGGTFTSDDIMDAEYDELRHALEHWGIT